MKLNRQSSPFVLATALLTTLAAVGCGGSDVDLVKVTGTVTMNGEPVADAEVLFKPVAGGRLSHGKTDAEGRYTLEYLPGQRGAIVGAHQVSVSTYVEPDTDSSDPEKMAGRPETIPAEFNSRTTLEAELEPAGSTVLDFDLEAEEQLAQGSGKK